MNRERRRFTQADYDRWFEVGVWFAVIGILGFIAWVQS